MISEYNPPFGVIRLTEAHLPAREKNSSFFCRCFFLKLFFCKPGEDGAETIPKSKPAPMDS